MANVQWTQAQVDSVVSAVNNRAKIASPTFTGTVGGITKTMVGLGSADNTSDANKPVSTATQTALNLKANLASPTFTGTVTAPTFSGALTGNATSASGVPWSGVTSKPTTLGGYGITDAAAQKATDSVYGGAKMSLSGSTLTITTT